MADRSARTEMGGQRASFRTTHWSQILSVHTQDEVRQRTVLNELARDYWKPVYCYLRHKGYDNETAKDLVQGFFADVVFDRRLVQRAEPRKGRFRTLLLAALDRYVIDEARSPSRTHQLGSDQGCECPERLRRSDS